MVDGHFIYCLTKYLDFAIRHNDTAHVLSIVISHTA